MTRHTLLIKYRETKSKYYKFKHKLDRKSASGRIHLLSTRQKNHLLRLIDKFKRRLAHLEKLLKATAAGGALSFTLHYATPVFAQTSPGDVFQISPQGDGNHTSSKIATDEQGNFVVVWGGEPEDSETGFDIYARRYTRNGTPQGDQILVNTTLEGDQQHAGVDMDDEGNFVVVWEHENPLDENENNIDIYARRFDTNGTPSGEDFPVEGSTAHTANYPTVAINNEGDAFFAWEAFLPHKNIRAQIYPDDATPLEMLNVSTSTENDALDSRPQACRDADGGFWVTYARQLTENIYATYYQTDNTTPFEDGAVSLSSRLGSTGDFQNFSNHSNPSITQAPDGGFFTSWSVSAYQFVASQWDQEANPVKYSNLFANNIVSSSSSIGHGEEGNISVSWSNGEAVQVTTLSPSLEILNTKEVPDESENYIEDTDIIVYGQGSYVVSWDIFRETAESPIEEVYAARFLPYIAELEDQGEYFVSDTAADNENYRPAVAAVPDGDFVVTWIADTASSNSTLRARRFDHEGNPISDEFIIHEFVPSEVPAEPDIVMDTEGGFIVTWHAEIDVNESGTYFARYDNENTLLDPSPVHFGEGTTHQNPRIAMDADGDFGIVWESYGYNSISLQRFDNEGNEVYEEPILIVDSEDFISKDRPAIAMDADGDIAVVWQEDHQYNDGVTIHVRRFTKDGNPSSEPILIEDESFTYNRLPDVQIDPQGDIMISWLGTTNNEGAVMSKRFTPDLAESNDATTGSDIYSFGNFDFSRSRIAFDESGDYAVTSTKYQSNGGDDVIMQRYNQDATPNGDEITVNALQPGQRGFVDLAMLGNDASVVVWEDNSEGSPNIKMKRFNVPAPPTLSAEYPEELVLVEGNEDTIRFALSTIPAEPVLLTLTPDKDDIDLGSGPGMSHTIVFQPDVSALDWQEVNILAVAQEETLGERNVTINFEAESEDPRFTQDILAPSMPPIAVTVRDAEQTTDRPPITIYNAISPNGDGKNEFLFIENIEEYKNNRVYIYNRWGDMIAEFKDYHNETNHWVPNEDVQAGSYHVVVTLGEPKDNKTAYIVVKK